MKFEICCNSIESCIAAYKAGADRVELCSSLVEGGVTPSYGVIVAACCDYDIDVNVLIRPRGGDFVYSDIELDIMIEDIKMCKAAGANGVVFGCLNSEWGVDMAAMQKLMCHCDGLDVTFHRAFDHCIDPSSALENIISLGCSRILTSGQSATAAEGSLLLGELVKQAAGRLIIMAGCGITIDNAVSVVKQSLVSEIHFSASSPRNNNIRKHNSSVDFGVEPTVSDSEKIECIMKSVKGIAL